MLSRWLWERGEKGGASLQKQTRAALCCNAMNESDVPLKFCLLIIFLCCGDVETVLVWAFAGDEARPLGSVLG